MESLSKRFWDQHKSLDWEFSTLLQDSGTSSSSILSTPSPVCTP